MNPLPRIVTNIPGEQVSRAIRELEESIEVDRTEIGHYQILARTLSVTSVTAADVARTQTVVDMALREKDESVKVLQGLVRMKYDEINGKRGVVGFLQRLSCYTA